MSSSKQKSVKIFGVPLDLGNKPLGVEMGPSAIRYAGIVDAMELNGIKCIDYGNLVINNIDHNKTIEVIARVSNELAGLVAGAIGEGFIPIILGGDHSIAIGSIAGASKKSKRMGLLWLDCHPDANTPETSPSGNIHGMPVAISLGHGYSQLVNCADHSPKILPEDICIIGAKDIDKEEKEFLDNLGVKMFTVHDIVKDGIVNVFDEAYKIVSKKSDHIHVSFDIDVLDPIIAPGTGILSRGGLSFREISYIMESLGEKDAISSIDIIEINPLLDIRNQTSELAIELLLSGLGGTYGDYERNYLNNRDI